jgi:hypothetical protein
VSSRPLAILLFVVGCQPTSLRPVWVPDLPEEDLAIVEVSTTIHILGVDQKPLDVSRPTRVALDPGHHVLRFYLHVRGSSSAAVDAAVTLGRGHRYQIRTNDEWRPDKVTFGIVDSVTGSVVWTSRAEFGIPESSLNMVSDREI